MSVYTHKSAKLSKQCSSSFKVTTFFLFKKEKMRLFFGPQGIWQLAYKNLVLPLFLFSCLTLHPGEMLLLYPVAVAPGHVVGVNYTHTYIRTLGLSFLVDYWLTAETTRKKKQKNFVVVLLFHGFQLLLYL